MTRILCPRCHAVLWLTPSHSASFMALIPFELAAIRYMAISQVRSGSFVLWRAVPDPTKCLCRQSRQVNWSGRVEIRELRCMTPQRGHTGPSGRRACSNQRRASASVAHLRMSVLNFTPLHTHQRPNRSRNVQQVDRSAFRIPEAGFAKGTLRKATYVDCRSGSHGLEDRAGARISRRTPLSLPGTQTLYTPIRNIMVRCNVP